MAFFTFEAIPSWVHVCVYSFKFLCSDKTKRPVVPAYPYGNLIEDNMELYRDADWLSVDFESSIRHFKIVNFLSPTKLIKISSETGFGTINILRKQRTGWVQEMAFFAYVQYIKHAYIVGGWIRKSPKTCIRNI